MLALVLDDSEMNNLLVAQALKPVAECEPIAFTCPVTALAFLRANVDRIGVVVTDYDMPDLTGLDVIAAARAVPGFEHVPIVMVTSLDQRSLRHQALRAGATDFLANLRSRRDPGAHHQFDEDQLGSPAGAGSGCVACPRGCGRGRGDRGAGARDHRPADACRREHRDTDTGDHIARVAGYVGVIARNSASQRRTSRS